MKPEDLKLPYEISLTYHAVVMVGPEEDPEEIARSEASEIISDYNFEPVVNVGCAIYSREELAAHSANTPHGYDENDLPYNGDGKTPLGKLLEVIEEAELIKAGVDANRCALTVDMFGEEKPVGVHVPAYELPPDFRQMLAKRFCGNPDGWAWASMRHVGQGEGAGTIIEWGIPHIGPGGKNRWAGIILDELIVTEAQIAAEALRWEQETGKCQHCAGTGKRNNIWNHLNGYGFIDCEPCGATGKAPING